MFSGNNHFFKALIGMRIDEIVNEVAHQAVYVKNLIGDEVGLVHPLTFDNHSQFLYKELIKHSKFDVVQTYYQHLTPSHLIHAVQRKVNAEFAKGDNYLYTPLNAMLDPLDQGKAWHIDMSGERIHLTEKGAILLLAKMRAVNLLNSE